ncbi:MAG: tetratricopeptide repeat protein [Alistipes sp.]|nr:tetratricopeptide repeat protein [Alistipes sp.]
MNKLLPFAIPAILFCACLGACTHHSVILQMERAEALMDFCPDSSLMILDSIPRNSLHSIASRAKFALLRSQALDKTYCDLQSDSLIAPAADYYEHFGTDREKLLARYYLGRIEQNSGHGTSAIEIFLDAEPYAVRSGDHFYTGLLYGSIGMLYFTQNQFDKALEYYDRAYISYERAGKRDYMADILVAKGETFSNTNKNTIALQHYIDALILANEENDYMVQASALRSLALTYYDSCPEQGKIYIDSLYSILDGQFTIQDYIFQSAIYCNLNKLDEAESIILDIVPYTRDNITQYIQTRQVLTNIYKRRDDYKTASIYNAELQRLNDSILLSNQQNSLLDKEAEIRRMQTLDSQERDITLLLLLFLILTIAFLLVSSYLIRYKTKKERMELAMRKALRNKYDFFKISAETMYQSYSEEKAVRKIDDMLKEVFKEEIFIDMEQSLNAQHDDIFARILENVRLSEKDYKHLLLICCGFCSRSSAEILDSNPDALYKNKSRIIEKLEKSKLPGTDRIIALMKGKADSAQQKKARKRPKKTPENTMSEKRRKAKA